MSRPIVIVESPFKGRGDMDWERRRDAELNLAYARAAVRDCILRGEAPYASHLIYTQPGILRDGDPEERKLGIDVGLEFARHADLVAFYIDRGVTEGMRYALEAHQAAGRRIEHRRLIAKDIG